MMSKHCTWWLRRDGDALYKVPVIEVRVVELEWFAPVLFLAFTASSYRTSWWCLRWLYKSVALPCGTAILAKHCLQVMSFWFSLSSLKPKNFPHHRVRVHSHWGCHSHYLQKGFPLHSLTCLFFQPTGLCCLHHVIHLEMRMHISMNQDHYDFSAALMRMVRKQRVHSAGQT